MPNHLLRHRVRGLAVWLLAVLIPAGAAGRDIYVNVQTGSDEGDGSLQAPLATAQKAVGLAQKGDTIHLLPEGAVIRQEIVLSGREGITIDGHGSTLTGADPLPADGWEPVAPGLVRRQLPTPAMGRHLLIVGGRANRMGRSPTVRAAFPPPEKLQPGDFAWVAVGEKLGWLYVRGPVDRLEWSVRVAGVRTGGRNRDITIRDLNCRHALNDGFNIHGDCRGLRCRRITGYENFDEGFSAHDTCQCWIDEGRFWGNDNAVADVNQADTFYRDCEFRDSVSTEVLFSGGKHSLDHCRVLAAGKSAFSASSTTMTRDRTQRVPIEVRLTRCEFRSVDDPPRRFALSDAQVTLQKCTLARVALSVTKSLLECEESTLDGRTLERRDTR